MASVSASPPFAAKAARAARQAFMAESAMAALASAISESRDSSTLRASAISSSSLIFACPERPAMLIPLIWSSQAVAANST
jgi:hypothetical protein